MACKIYQKGQFFAPMFIIKRRNQFLFWPKNRSISFKSLEIYFEQWLSNTADFHIVNTIHGVKFWMLCKTLQSTWSYPVHCSNYYIHDVFSIFNFLAQNDSRCMIQWNYLSQSLHSVSFSSWSVIRYEHTHYYDSIRKYK